MAVKKPITTTKGAITAVAPLMPLETLLGQLGEGDKLVKAVQQKSLLPKLAEQLEHCAALDHESDAIGPTLGEFCHKILVLPLEAQKTITTLLAGQLGIEPPSYDSSGRGRPTTGRDQLAAIIYHRYPEDLKKDGKDSKAGKRLTDHVRRYMEKAGLKASPKDTGGDSDSPATYGRYKKLFTELFNIANREEKPVLFRLFHRLGVPSKTILKWGGEDLLDSIIDVTPELPTGTEG